MVASPNGGLRFRGDDMVGGVQQPTQSWPLSIPFPRCHSRGSGNLCFWRDKGGSTEVPAFAGMTWWGVGQQPTRSWQFSSPFPRSHSRESGNLCLLPAELGTEFPAFAG